MLRQSAPSDPPELRTQVESLTAQLDRLLEWYENGSLKFEDLNQAYLERQPETEALVNALLSYVPTADSRIKRHSSQHGNLRTIYHSDDLGIVRCPLSEGAAATQLCLVIEHLQQLVTYLPNR
jgi:hypothetical protein